jgi:adenylate kinase
MGAPGCGKGTQSSILEAQFGMKCISTGSILRDASKQDTASGRRLRKIMSSGGLVDDATVCKAVASRIRVFLVSRDPDQGDLILDGFPRTVKQAQWLDQLLEDLDSPGPTVIHLDVPDNVLVHRLTRRRQCATCGAIYNLASGAAAARGRCESDGGELVERDDDNEGTVQRRLAAYDSETFPVIEYYRRHDYRNGAYRRIDGNRSAAEIAKDVCETVVFAETAVAA